jgi:hypothetical protein
VRSILSNIGVVVLPEQKTLPNAYDIFDNEGNLKDPDRQEAVKELGRKLATVTAKLNG